MIAKEIKYGTSAERKPPAQGHPGLFSKSSKSTLLPPILSLTAAKESLWVTLVFTNPIMPFFQVLAKPKIQLATTLWDIILSPFLSSPRSSVPLVQGLCILILILPSKQSTYGLSLTTLCPPNYLFSQLRNPACFESFPRLIKELKLFSYSIWVWKSQKLLLPLFIISPPNFYKSHLCPYKMFILSLFWSLYHPFRSLVSIMQCVTCVDASVSLHCLQFQSPRWPAHFRGSPPLLLCHRPLALNESALIMMS